MMILGLVALLAAAAPCTPVPGADRLWQPATRWVIVGEMHGTAETPAAFVNLVCLAAESGRPVTVSIEYSEDLQPEIDAYLASDGGDEARAALLKMKAWAGRQDGRGSIAFLRMFERLRVLKQSGRITGVIATDIGKSWSESEERDAAIARLWRAIPTPNNDIVLALVGNFHASRTALITPDKTINPAASLMPPERTVTINVVGNGGQAWFCGRGGCAAQFNGEPREAPAGITYSEDTDRRWDATYELGVPTTAAPPALSPAGGR